MPGCAALRALYACSEGMMLTTLAPLLEAFRAYDTPLPPLTSVALAPWLLPGAVGLGFVLTAGAMVAPLRRSQRNAIVGAALVISSTALVFAVLAAFAPIFRPT